MHLRQVGRQLGEQLQADEEAVKRILVQLVAAPEEIVEKFPVALEIAEEERLRQFALVTEVIEEAALGDPGRGYQLLDRGRRKALGEHRTLGKLKQPLARRALP